MIEHTGADARATRGFVNRHLPDEQCFGIGWQPISRYPSDDTAISFSYHAGIGKVRTLQQIAISRIGIQRRAIANEPGNRRTVFADWRTQLESSAADRICASGNVDSCVNYSGSAPIGIADRIDTSSTEVFKLTSLIFNAAKQVAYAEYMNKVSISTRNVEKIELSS